MTSVVPLLAGTGEGPHLVKELCRRNWRVSVSVVTSGAAKFTRGYRCRESRPVPCKVLAVSLPLCGSRDPSVGLSMPPIPLVADQS